MHLNKEQKDVVIGIVLYVLDRLYETVNHDKQGIINLKHELSIQDSQIAGWRAGRSMPNMSTIYRLALRAGVLHEITEAIQEVPGLKHLPTLVPVSKETS